MESLQSGHPCIVHCSDGWDRTPQVCATVQLLMDSHYRTIHGFATLIEKSGARSVTNLVTAMVE